MASSIPKKSDLLPEKNADLPSLDTRLSTLLEAIETERTPDRLLSLAQELQQELFLRKQRRTPN